MVVYTVKGLADLAGVSTRTLHYYDQIGLLRPSSYRRNGYRRYDEAAVLRLQQIMFYREIDFSLAEIQAIIDGPEFDITRALQAHRQALSRRIGRLSDLVATIDQTILHMRGELTMETTDLFGGFDQARQQRYEEEVTQTYGPERVIESRRRWAGYSADDRARIQAEGTAIYADAASAVGQDPASPQVQRIVERWRQHLRYFYEPTPATLRGLGQVYAEDPAFSAVFQQLHPDLPDFLRQAITAYCQNIAAGDAGVCRSAPPTRARR